jgi:hypothetical protein
MRRGRHQKKVEHKIRRVLAALSIVAATMIVVPFAQADAGGGPGSNHGCAGHQPPPPPGGGCGK